jgi:hypothetical protein
MYSLSSETYRLSHRIYIQTEQLWLRPAFSSPPHSADSQQPGPNPSELDLSINAPSTAQRSMMPSASSISLDHQQQPFAALSSRFLEPRS